MVPEDAQRRFVDRVTWTLPQDCLVWPLESFVPSTGSVSELPPTTMQYTPAHTAYPFLEPRTISWPCTQSFSQEFSYKTPEHMLYSLLPLPSSFATNDAPPPLHHTDAHLFAQAPDLRAHSTQDSGILAHAATHVSGAIQSFSHWGDFHLSAPSVELRSGITVQRSDTHTDFVPHHDTDGGLPTNNEPEITSSDDGQSKSSLSATSFLALTDASRPITPLDPDDPNWKMSKDKYEWLFAVLYPKRRSNKGQNAPSGQCWLCHSVSKRAGSLQQHLAVIHRQRLARKVRAGRQYNHLLALAFVIAQVEAEERSISGKGYNLSASECDRFQVLLALGPISKETLPTNLFPTLFQRLMEFCFRESWVGVSCLKCGTWATRRVAMKEHALICPGPPETHSSSASPSPRLDLPIVPTLRLTQSGQAARPSRGRSLRRRRLGTKVISNTQDIT